MNSLLFVFLDHSVATDTLGTLLSSIKITFSGSPHISVTIFSAGSSSCPPKIRCYLEFVSRNNSSFPEVNEDER